ncbi:MAG: Tyrosine-tRNA ligase [Microgenomates group bacterium GW2011_GWB1_40_9]|nr:MAG: Tyrosine-tRNA ligase [Microgenomates group bacterium GW2011_GWC1_39_12]KKR80118.1 MAG: Tyrosine-tRNA ligase [Microgenomates group bacterium GW2011_GWB1_40_9]
MDAIDILLTRGVDGIYPSHDALEKVLRSGKKLKLYQGFDPSGTQFHIGHAVGLRKLRQWQDLGHHVIFLIGDGTGQAGDPSGKTRSRGKFLTNEELRQNAKDYVLQAKKIVRFDGPNPAEILYNGDWLNKLTLVDILDIAGHFSWQQLAERDLYQERIKSGEELNFREALYPLLQGYDSVAMNVDLELGGKDQLFNMLAGRQLVSQILHKEKFVMTVPLLTDSKGTKIGKTEGNVIGLTDAPAEFYAKIMSLGDDAIIPCFTLLTDISTEEIEAKMKQGENPMTLKKQLAFELTKMLNDEKLAKKAQEEFESVHQKGESVSVTAPVFETKQTDWNIIDLFIATNQVTSKSEARRLFEQQAIEINNAKCQMLNIKLKDGDIIKIGKRKFVKIHVI